MTSRLDRAVDVDDVVSDYHLDAYVTRHATWAPGSLAVADPRVRLTFRQLDERVNRLANVLTDAGVRKGDRIAFLLGNAAEVFEGFYACARVGAVRVPLNDKDSPADQQHKLSLSAPTVVVTHAEPWRKLASLVDVRDLPDLRLVLAVGDDRAEPDALVRDYETELAGASNDPPPPVVVGGSDVFRFGWTGGTTGRSKAAMRTVDNEIALLQNILADLADPGAASVLLHAMPLSHASGLLALAYVARGAANVVMPRFDVADFVDTVDDFGATDTFLVPTALYKLLERKDDIDVERLTTLQTIVYGAAPIATDRMRQLVDWLGYRFVQSYGQAEATLTISTLRKRDHEDPAATGTAGRPATRVDVRLLDDEGRVVPQGETGEICVRSPHVMVGYWRNDTATDEALRGGWLHTGDLGVMTSQGLLRLMDRKSGMILTGGFNVYPSEVEEALYSCRGVHEVAVVGIPDDLWGEAVTAVVVPKPGADVVELEANLRAAAEERLGAYKRPKRYVMWRDREVPKTPLGKVAHAELRQQVERDDHGGHG